MLRSYIFLLNFSLRLVLLIVWMVWWGQDFGRLIWISAWNRLLLASLGGRLDSGTPGYCPIDFDDESVWFLPRNTCNGKRSQPDYSCVRLVTYSQISVNEFGNSGLILSQSSSYIRWYGCGLGWAVLFWHRTKPELDKLWGLKNV